MNVSISIYVVRDSDLIASIPHVNYVCLVMRPFSLLLSSSSSLLSAYLLNITCSHCFMFKAFLKFYTSKLASLIASFPHGEQGFPGNERGKTMAIFLVIAELS